MNLSPGGLDEPGFPYFASDKFDFGYGGPPFHPHDSPFFPGHPGMPFNGPGKIFMIFWVTSIWFILFSLHRWTNGASWTNGRNGHRLRYDTRCDLLESTQRTFTRLTRKSRARWIAWIHDQYGKFFWIVEHQRGSGLVKVNDVDVVVCIKRQKRTNLKKNYGMGKKMKL